MPLTDSAFEEAEKTGKRRRCEICRLLADIPSNERIVLERQLAKDRFDMPPGTLVNVLRAEGYENVNTNHVVHHRAGKCGGV